MLGMVISNDSSQRGSTQPSFQGGEPPPLVRHLEAVADTMPEELDRVVEASWRIW